MPFPPNNLPENAANSAQLPVIDAVARSSADQISAATCCAAPRRLIVPALAIATFVSIGLAAYFAGRAQMAESKLTAADFPILHATSAVSSEKFSCATGEISEEADGLFVLDHNSGLLQCSVIYPRLGRFMGQFTVNVAETLGTGGKGGSYLMLTGRVDFPRASNNPVASTVVYVMDTATGNYASYYVPFNRQAMTAGQAQQNTMKLLATGSANPVIDRDALR